MSDILLTGVLAGVGWAPFTQWPIWGFLLEGLLVALGIAGTSIAVSVLIGVVLAVGRLSQLRVLRWPAGAYVEVFRATPLLLLILFVFFGSARARVELSAVAAVTIALTFYNSAVIAEIVRAGILSISRGVIEAARGLGLTYLQSMLYVAIPMALRRMAPAIVSQLITLFKDTSLASVLGVLELSRRARVIYDTPTYGNPIEVLTIVAALYFIPSYALSLLAQRLERSADHTRGR